MMNINIIVTANFGLESVVKHELYDLGYDNLVVQDGRIKFNGDLRDVTILNLRLRCAERVLIEVASFEAYSFEELFNSVNAIDWARWISKEGNFIINAKSYKSKLFSLSDIQRISEKAIIKSLQRTYAINRFEKTAERYSIEVAIRNDIVSVTIDTSGEGLHKRGYREASYKAPITETLAAAMVKLSYWNPDRLLVDPFCGSGTILIEAAMIAKQIAPGLMRKFDFEKFIFMDENLLKEEKARCYSEIDYDKKLEIIGSDISRKAIEIAKMNAEILGLEEDIRFFVKDVRELDLPDNYGVIITNPPYGIRIGEVEEVKELEQALRELYKSLPTYSMYVISADENIEKNLGKSDKNRKLYNGGLRSYLFQYFGPKPL
ncbi:putative N6-adenine-specific DNA methylase [Peptoniphilus asaccharolyticus DSM 20463]|uniref:Putative N6-adenine-specific DNA methylase n=1 Tax=Peptoniphilus asaccharolyticus DSM 20463 TaxID=573058 RepID=A0A1W1VJQ8_PEPAS|nr:class I SAM-dependent RNA methyltransferase [Peptoniphilus asaccharolyticus]MBL7574373.1 class I SAM-dependent RNA methyltransferase [Peptoniphilus asaccharolyticus]SMB93291.1 putative N6-adenine-specific DNA methylase [Peptoniphilus asaccharolyticus DSM 20463]